MHTKRKFYCIEITSGWRWASWAYCCRRRRGSSTILFAFPLSSRVSFELLFHSAFLYSPSLGIYRILLHARYCAEATFLLCSSYIFANIVRQRHFGCSTFIEAMVPAQISRKYNLKITHETIRIGVCDTLEELLVPAKEATNCFADIVKWHFVLYYDNYIEIVKKNSHATGRCSVSRVQTLQHTHTHTHTHTQPGNRLSSNPTKL